MTSDNPPGSTDDDRRADEEAIHALLHRQITAWDAGDPDAYAAVYTPDGDCVSFLGSHHCGREAIQGRVVGACARTPASRYEPMTDGYWPPRTTVVSGRLQKSH